ncbi:hypothetical protein [Streptomyces sp. NPDC002265]|uniref:hypothetical protein n=1 Tax=Streptomyces sp. NPDC002265 TaxID=3154415 RepID=UPI00331D4EDD
MARAGRNQRLARPIPTPRNPQGAAMPDTRRWKPVDDWFAEAGESWATITATQPGGPYRAP